MISWFQAFAFACNSRRYVVARLHIPRGTVVHLEEGGVEYGFSAQTAFVQGYNFGLWKGVLAAAVGLLHPTPGPGVRLVTWTPCRLSSVAPCFVTHNNNVSEKWWCPSLRGGARGGRGEAAGVEVGAGAGAQRLHQGGAVQLLNPVDP